MKVYVYTREVDKDSYPDGLARSVHMVCAYLNFILMSLHLGLHWNAMMSAIIKKRGNGSDHSHYPPRQHRQG